MFILQPGFFISNQFNFFDLFYFHFTVVWVTLIIMGKNHEKTNDFHFTTALLESIL